MNCWQTCSVILFLLLTTQASVARDQFTLEGTIFETIGADHGVDPLLLYAIAITESATGAGNGYIGPSPYVFRTSGGPRFFKSKSVAETELSAVLKTTQNVDVGMMQINLRYHPQSDPLNLLDPHHNLTVAAKYLKKTMASTDDPVIGVGRYHSWTKDLAKWYGERVWQIYRNLQRITVFQ